MSTPPTKPMGPPAGLVPPVEPAPTSAPPAAPAPKVVDLPSGKELDDAGAAKLQAARLVRLIVVAGPPGAGKTTLVTSLYELFQKKPVGKIAFGGSGTLPAFERRCHISRTASERSVPDTERTPYGEVRYLHLRVGSDDLRHNPLDLLFTDVSGESFERARDSISECQQLGFLKMADHFLLLMDCEKLIDRVKRWDAANDSMALLQSCLDSGMLGNNCFVNVLWTKYDFVEAAADSTHEQFFEKTINEFKTRFGTRVSRLTFTKVAARPMGVDNLEFGYGIPELLKEWSNDSPRDRAMNLIPEDTAGSRESEKFLTRHLDKVRET
jgi:energy-coupling factor transporter ATP-binding protein EcfA2